jgi:DNA-binding MarR family transcriptional regulator
MRAATPPAARVAADQDPLAMQCACLQVRKAARAVTALYDRALAGETGLRITQFTLLMAIDELRDATVGRLADLLVMDRTTLTRDLKPLVTEGLLKVSAGDDRRTRVVRLTRAGARRLEQAIPLWQRVQAQVIGEGLGQGRWNGMKQDLHALTQVALRS